jgi:hypothetical protein
VEALRRARSRDGAIAVAQKRMEERPYSTTGRTHSVGRSSVIARCPFCDREVTIYLWSIAGSGKKKCLCGAALHADGVARKLVEATP